MSNLLVKRNTFSQYSTIGELSVDGVQKYFTLEPPKHEPPVKPRAIPAGTYELAILYSPRFNRQMPHVLNIPDFEGILIHWGNYPKDTEGCLLVGNVKGPYPDFIGQSRAAFDELLTNLTAGSITYVNE